MTEIHGGADPRKPDAPAIRSWMITRLAELTGIPAAAVDTRQPFTSYGLGSLEAVEISGELSERLGRELSPTMLYDYPNIEELARHLADEPGRPAPAITPRRSYESADPIAVIGMGCRFPAAANPSQFWDLLRDGVDAIVEVPPDRWNAQAVAAGSWAKGDGKSSVGWGGFLDQVDQFDAQFFGMAPRETEHVDPQQRLFLEVSWEALEDAGLAPDRLAGSNCGVFVGVSSSDYSRLYRDLGMLTAYTGTGNAHSVTANRLSYLLDLRGPSLAVDTACSSSLVAIHLACESLRRGGCDLALAGGVNVMLSPELTVTFSRANMMAADGRCKTFDAAADGYVRGEGCGVVVLQRLSDAQREGNRILASVRGSALNQDGRSNGLTAPNGPAQEAVIGQALQNAGVAAAGISYVEAHGTGTLLGDPIELEALKAVLSHGRLPDQRCAVGSVKTNIGHLEAAAGVASVIKVVLALQHEAIPKHLHFKKLNPLISLEGTPFRIPTQTAAWPRNGSPRLAGVSSFGFGGANAHLVLEEAPAPAPAPADCERSSHILALSAQTPEALRVLTNRYQEHLAANPGISLADVCFAANTGRARFPYRLAVNAPSAQKMRERLASYCSGHESEDACAGYVQGRTRPKIAFLFTGQGSQYAGMGRQLFETQPAFRRTLQRCDELLRPHLEQPLLEALYPEPGRATPLDQQIYAQPALFAVEYALAELWRTWGVEPAVVMGHSIGEYAAASVAGVFTLEEGLGLVAERGRLMQALTGTGEMSVVFADERTVAAALAGYEDRAAIAALNGPRNTVVSGERSAVEAVLSRLEGDGFRVQRLNTSHAFHSPLVEPMLGELESAAAKIAFADPHIALISNVTGKPTDAAPDARYWARHTRETVKFSEGLERIRQAGCELLLEVGPSPVLLGLAKKCSEDDRVIYLPTLRQGRDNWQQVLRTLAAVHARGIDVDWSAFDAGYSRRRLSLPTYPFERKRYWIESAEPASLTPERRSPPPRASRGRSIHPLLGDRLTSPLQHAQFECRLGVETFATLSDHRIHGTVLFPAAAYLEIFLAAAAETFGPGSHALSAFTIHEALAFPSAAIRIAHIVVGPSEGGVAPCQLFCLELDRADQNEWRLHASGTIHIDDSAAAPPSCPPSWEQVLQQGAVERSGESYYRELREHGLEYGASHRAIHRLLRRDGEALGELRLPETVPETPGYLLDPILLDAGFQLAAATLSTADLSALGSELYLPVGAQRCRIHGPGKGIVRAHFVLRSGGAQQRILTGDLLLFDEAGSPVAEVAGLSFQRMSPETMLRLARSEQPGDYLYEIAWTPQTRQASAAAEPTVRFGCGVWLVFEGEDGGGSELAARLRSRGEVCVSAVPGEQFAKLSDHRYAVVPDRLQDFETLLGEIVTTERTDLRGIVYMWNSSPGGAAPSSRSIAAKARNCAGVLYLLQAVARLRPVSPPRLWIVTRAAQPAGDDATPVDPAGAPLWGMASTIALEHPELCCTRIDLDATEDSETPGPLFEEIWTPSREDQIAFRRGERYVRRMVRSTSMHGPLGNAPGSVDGQPFRLDVAEAGSLERLVFRPAARRPPGAGEVEIRVHATGLNFRDVMGAMAMYPGNPGPPGGECSGTIVAVGEGVTEHRIGEDVLAVAPGCFSMYVTTPAGLVMPKPVTLNFEEAAATPIAFLTAFFALERLAKLSAGETVLIHAAAGGVGLAAVQVAQRAGATVIATAGSPAKREFLAALGVKNCFNSRTLDFASQVMECTGGRGVDVVLNSLARDFIPRSLVVLARGGRFVEIGKTGIWDADQVKRFREDVSYFILDLVELCQSSLPSVTSAFQEIVCALDESKLKPLPLRIFPVEQATRAFRHMSRARHIGKIVVTQERAIRAEALQSSPLFRADGTYLITGGTGALGLAVARWMVDNGARHLALAARRRPSSSACEVLTELEKAGARVVTFELDVADDLELGRALAEMKRSMPPLRGLIHAAGMLDDGLLASQDWDRFATVLAPKVEGSWNLHNLTLDLPLDFFVLFSSVASLLGSPAQGSYASANAFLDSLAHCRISQGLTATSINWGAWEGLGMAASQGGAASRWAGKGIGAIPAQQALHILGQVIRRAPVQLAVAPICWPEVVRKLPSIGELPLVSDLVSGSLEAGGPPPGVMPAIKRQLLDASPGERPNLLIAHIRDQVVKVLGLDRTQPVDARRPLGEMGLDSLMGVELVDTVARSLDTSLPAAILFDYPTIEALATYLSAEILRVDVGTERRGPEMDEDGRLAAALARIEQLSEAEAGAILTQKLSAQGNCNE